LDWDNTQLSLSKHLHQTRPDGYTDESRDYVSAYLELVTEDVEVKAGFDMGLVTPHGPDTIDAIIHEDPMVFGDEIRSWGLHQFMKRSVLESSPYLHDDRLVIMCEVTVVKEETLVEETALDSEVQVPPSDLSLHLGKLLVSEEETDVAFQVRKEVFPAHRIVLAMRSPV
jgi:speckle-type POZ protein